MTLRLAPVLPPMVTGTEEDLRTAQAVLASLRPHCPRCARADVTPLTWYEAVIWFQCARCYKLWREDVDKPAAISPAPAATQSSAQPMPEDMCRRGRVLASRWTSGHPRPPLRRRVG